MELKTKKDEAFWKVLSAAIELDFRKGHLKWTMTELSRKSGVTRSLVYYYFGRSKLNIVKSAVKIMGDELVGLSDRRTKMWRDGKYLESLRESREIMEKAPYIGAFYLTYRSWPNELGEALRSMEDHLIKKIKIFIPSLQGHEVQAIATIYFGLVFSPFSSDKVLQEIVPALSKVFERKSGSTGPMSPSHQTI